MNAGLFRGAIAVSLAAHLGLAALLLRTDSPQSGAVRDQRPAISVNLELTRVMDSVQSEAAEEAAASQAGAAAVEAPSETENNDPQAAADQLPEPVRELATSAPRQDGQVRASPLQTERQTPADAEGEVVTSLDHTAGQALASRRAEAEARDQAEQERAAKAQREAQEQAQREQERQAADDVAEARAAERNKVREPNDTASGARPKLAEHPRTGGGASGAGEARPSAGRVSAATGSIRDYGAIVRARVATTRPAGQAASGTVVITLAIAPSGHLASARVAKSSGRPSLDQSALAAVRRASPFPPPPAGQSVQFSLPFQFR